MSYIKYTTDILRRKDNYVIEFTEIDENDIIGIITRSRYLGCPIISRTYPSRRYPQGGKWYLKGRGIEYSVLKKQLENAYDNGTYPTVDTYIITL